MKKKAPKTYDDLIKSYYGGSDAAGWRDLAEFGELFATYYGKPSARKGKPSIVLSVRCDDGETITQHPKSTPETPAKGIIQPKVEEYVVAAPRVAPAMSRQWVFPQSAPLDHDRIAYQECRVDILDPLKENEPAPAPAPKTIAAASPTESKQASTGDDDFMADMQSILSGQMMFDPITKRTIKTDKLGRPESQPYGPPAPDANNGQAIFDRIAQSMQHATAFDLGTVELKNRFEDFDRFAELQRKTAEARKSPAKVAGSRPSGNSGVGNEEFIRDLDSIKTSPIAKQQSTDRYSYPLYDTGEHVRASADLYGERFHVGKPPGALFTYGQIIAMADLFASVDQMMDSSASDLSRIKALIERSTKYYDGNKADSSLNVSSAEWEKATGNRYLKLAADNYEHFSPNILLKNEAFAKVPHKHGDNRSAWERHHKRAIEEAQRLFMSQAANSSVFPEWPLIINAFGDHYLTDAFASGHLINKETMIEYFKAQFLQGGSLRPEAEKFFDKVAEMAFRGQVAQKFSTLETSNYPVCKWGWCIKWHPNINSASRFSEVLKGAAKQEPEKVANFAVKALHDRLNKDGIEVTNNAGDGTWKLTGDEYLNATSLAIMQRAVQQSIDNINDPSIYASSLNFAAYFAKVWKHVPQLTETSRKKVEVLAGEYMSPQSASLTKAAADLIYSEVDSLISELLAQNKLKAA